MNQVEDQQETTRLSEILSPNYTVSKRQLGILISFVGIIAFIGLLLLDVVGGGREGGIGPAQQAALILSGIATLFGLTLIPLGDKPA